MARTRSILGRALAIYLLLLPNLCPPTGAQSVRWSERDAARPLEPSEPVEPRQAPTDHETVYSPSTEVLTLRAFNGFSSNVTAGLFTHLGHGHAGGVATVASPWGERLRIRYWLTAHGPTFEYNGELKVRYRFDGDGTLQEIVAETADREARMAVGKRAELAYLGLRDPGSFDLSAYDLIEETLAARHSKAFLAGLGEFDAPARVSCTTQGIQCAACLVAWAVSVGAIATACIVGGVPTFGTACFLAILAHEATNFSCAATCIEWAEDCFGNTNPGAEPIPDGCEP